MAYFSIQQEARVALKLLNCGWKKNAEKQSKVEIVFNCNGNKNRFVQSVSLFSNGSVRLKKSWVMLPATIGSHNCLRILAELLGSSSWRSIVEFATMQRRRSDQTPVPLLYYNQSSQFLFCHSFATLAFCFFVVLLINGTFSSWPYVYKKW